MRIFLILLIILVPVIESQAQVTGLWTTIDDNTGKPRSVVEIFERGGLLYGRIQQIFPTPGRDADPVCKECDEDDPRFGKKVKGMEILRGLKKDGNAYSGGDILDPENGSVYRCKIWLDAENLMVRGYLGPFFRTQTWRRMK